MIAYFATSESQHITKVSVAHGRDWWHSHHRAFMHGQLFARVQSSVTYHVPRQPSTDFADDSQLEGARKPLQMMSQE